MVFGGMFGGGFNPIGMFWFWGWLMFMFAAFVLASYIYMGFAYTAIGKKAKLKNPSLAWIPFVGPAIIAFQASKMPWWPWLLLIGTIIPFVGWIFSIAFAVFWIIWHWKLFEKIKKPNWWAILLIIPIVNFVIIGIAAWSKK